MIYLILSIITSVVVVCFFKLFDKYNVNTLQAIVVNYIVCGIMGNVMADKPGILTSFWQEGWFPYTLVLGFLFISVFYSIAQTAQKMGVSVSMVAAKLSVAIPVTIAIFAQNEQVNILKITGIILSMVAVYFISHGAGSSSNKQLWVLPLYVFIGSGCIDTLLNMIDKNFIPPFDTNHILSFVFLTAFILGTGLMFIQQQKSKETFQLKSIYWGIALGIPNYLCMLFLLKTLNSFNEASLVLPINNIGIVMSTTLAGLLFFKEKTNLKNWIGLTLAVISIVMLAYN
jgi:drug/metabolite transporter (DMT)-like permease